MTSQTISEEEQTNLQLWKRLQQLLEKQGTVNLLGNEQIVRLEGHIHQLFATGDQVKFRLNPFTLVIEISQSYEGGKGFTSWESSDVTSHLKYAIEVLESVTGTPND